MRKATQALCETPLPGDVTWNSSYLRPRLNADFPEILRAMAALGKYHGGHMCCVASC